MKTVKSDELTERVINTHTHTHTKVGCFSNDGSK